jgi:uncharacterized protein YndB with AHSA1/START domain
MNSETRTCSNAGSFAHELFIERVLDAPRQNVWRCWTEIALIDEWFCPRPWRSYHSVLDVRVGGQAVLEMRGPNGESMPHAGVFLAVEPQARLVTTDAFVSAWVPASKAFMVAEVIFTDATNGGTHMRWSARHWTTEDRDRHLKMGFYEGWNAAATQLNAVASGL